MTRDDIYDHLAQVYLGKRKKVEEKKNRQFNAWLVINVVMTVIIFASVSYGLSAFLTHRSALLESRVIYSLHKGPIRMAYNFQDSVPPVKAFALSVDQIDASKYAEIRFSIRAKEEGSPGIIKVLVQNNLNEEASYYIQGIGFKWKEVHVPFDAFEEITDWSQLRDISFILESWNVEKDKGLILIDNIRFSS